MTQHKFGGVEVTSIIDGFTLVDPTHMYPCNSADTVTQLSQKYLDPITNQLVMSIGAYLVRTAAHLVLIDAGIGPAPKRASGGALPRNLLAIGVHPSDITDVVFTHLHFDHIGWAVQDGVPFFPNAQYHCDRRDWEHFMSSNYTTPESQNHLMDVATDAPPTKLAPIRDRINFWERDSTILPGIETRDAAGHTAGTTAFILGTGNARGVLIGDIAHSIPELLHGWTFRIHANPDAAVQTLLQTRNWLAETGHAVSGSHFQDLQWGKIVQDHATDSFMWIDENA